jgi:hypothetical protein
MELASIGGTPREEPSLETLWFKNKETMEKFQNLKSSKKYLLKEFQFYTL